MTRMIPTKEAILLRSDQHSVFVMEISLKDSENRNDKQLRQQDADKKTPQSFPFLCQRVWALLSWESSGAICIVPERSAMIAGVC
jgi:hypothetical protein